MKTLVLGLGNPILTDDGVGIRVARFLESGLGGAPGLDVAEASVGGLRLMQVVAGYDRVILVDAIQTAQGQPGEIYLLTLDAFCTTLHSGCSHDMDLFTALELGRRLGMDMPEDVHIVAIEAADVLSFGESCTPQVEAAIIPAAQEVLRLLRGGKKRPRPER